MFSRGGTLLRQVNQSYREPYERLKASGLYDALTGQGLLVRHEEIDELPAEPLSGYKVLRPQVVPFISYPYEWCFGQLKAAALATLAIQKSAMSRGMSLKDASAYNIQFLEDQPIFIDTLSFEYHVEGRPWIAYRQFCQHFLAPLLLMRHGHAGHGLLSRIHLDGIPLDVAGSMLPLTSWFRFPSLVHVHLHAWMQARPAHGRTAQSPADAGSATAASAPAYKPSGKNALRGLLDNLEAAVEALSLPRRPSIWAGYYSETNYSPRAFASKQDLVARLLGKAGSRPRRVPMAAPVVWDMGANTGVFSRLAAAQGMRTLAFDLDPVAVEINYREVVRKQERKVLPLVMDLSNPSPGIGWRNQERMSLSDRGPADIVMALALIHHLAIGNNLPFDRIVRCLADLGQSILIEFVPRSDSQVGRLLASRRGGFPEYTREAFENSFLADFDLVERVDIEDSERSLYLFEKRPDRP